MDKNKLKDAFRVVIEVFDNRHFALQRLPDITVLLCYNLLQNPHKTLIFMNHVTILL